MTQSKLVVLLLGASALTAFNADRAFAQDSTKTSAETPTKASQVQQDDTSAITVTARRREESIVQVPLAISVVTSKKLEQLNIESTSQLANFAPGLQFSDFTPNAARNDRGGTRALIFRGINTGTGGSVTAAGGLFLDGAAVVGNEVPAGMDIGQVEVLRGPQSVYFGRSTMTGAVSYRTKPISDKWTGEAELELAQYDTRHFEASVAGPVIPDLLKVRVTGLTEQNDGFITNDYDKGGPKLGARSRNSISGTADITPSSTLEFKAYINYFHDNDGPSATAFIPASLDNCQLPGATHTTFCGEIPGVSNSIHYFNTTLPANFAKAIFSSPLIANAGFKDRLGLQRNVLNSHFIGNWQISDYLKVQSITGFHTNVVVQAADGIAQPVKPSFPYQGYFYSATYRTRDFSQELRLSSDSTRRFSWTIGTNYIDAYNKTSPVVAYQDQVNGVPTTFRPIVQNITRDATTTYGFFGGAYFKITPALVLSAEGRYQIDKRRTSTISPTTLTSLTNISGSFKSFNPRVSLDWDVGGNKHLYTSYATGTRPGGFNASLVGYLAENNPALNQQIQQNLGLSNGDYKEERLKIGELGFKGSFAGGRGFFDLNGYYGKLLNQQVTQVGFIPLLGFSVTAFSNVGETEVYGIEWQGNYNLDRHLSVATTFAWNHADRTKFDNPSGISEFGTANLDGVPTSNTPHISGSAVVSYQRPINDKWQAFGNVSYVYRGKIYADVAALSYIKGRSQVDLRAGVSNDRYTIEGFVTNVFNNRQFTNGAVAGDFGTNSYYAFFGAYADPRTVGGRLRVKF
jgi:iron complex outermembrane receptor protein